MRERDKVNEMWGTDMSQTITPRGEGRAYVFVAVKHANSEIVGIHAARSARIDSRRSSRSGRGCIGASAPSRPAWRVGLSCVTDAWLQLYVRRFAGRGLNVWAWKLRRPSCANPRAIASPSASFRKLEGELALGADVTTIEELRAELVALARRYDETWLVARHGYKTPPRVREEQTMPRIAIDPTLAATLPLAA